MVQGAPVGTGSGWGLSCAQFAFNICLPFFWNVRLFLCLSDFELTCGVQAWTDASRKASSWDQGLESRQVAFAAGGTVSTVSWAKSWQGFKPCLSKLVCRQSLLLRARAPSAVLRAVDSLDLQAFCQGLG